MAKYEIKLKARVLRRDGKSLADITKLLDVSKGSVSLWCRDIHLSDFQTKILSIKSQTGSIKGRLKGTEANRQRRQSSLSDSREWAKKALSQISRRDLMITGVALYWAEGSKTDNTFGFLFVNSDPKMILIMCQWLNKIMNIPKDLIEPRISINESHRHRIEIVLKFWSRLLELPTSRFKSTFFVKTPHKKVYENHDTYYGVLRLRVAKSSILKYKTLALIEELKDIKMPE